MVNTTPLPSKILIFFYLFTGVQAYAPAATMPLNLTHELPCHRIPHEILGYNPHISSIPPARTTTKTPVVTVIGFPDPADMYCGKFDTDTTFTVTFAFHNTASWHWFFNPLSLARSISSINFGQEKDAQALLYTVIECYKKGHKKIHIFANSRGGATTIAMLDMLSNPHNHVQTWELFGITDSNTQEKIRTMVANGSIVLAHPLMHYDAAIQNTIATFTAKIFPFPGNSYLQDALYTCSKIFLKHCTSFDCTYPSPITTLATSISQPCWPYNITIALADYDSLVGHNHEQMLNYLAKLHPHKLKVIAGGKHHFDIKQCLKEARECWAQ